MVSRSHFIAFRLLTPATALKCAQVDIFERHDGIQDFSYLLRCLVCASLTLLHIHRVRSIIYIKVWICLRRLLASRSEVVDDELGSPRAELLAQPVVRKQHQQVKPG